MENRTVKLVFGTGKPDHQRLMRLPGPRTLRSKVKIGEEGFTASV